MKPGGFQFQFENILTDVLSFSIRPGRLKAETGRLPGIGPDVVLLMKMVTKASACAGLLIFDGSGHPGRRTIPRKEVSMSAIIKLSQEERNILQTWIKTPWTRPRMALRARIVLAAAAGRKISEIAELLSVQAATACKWTGRFAAGRVDGLYDRPRPGRPGTCSPDIEDRITALLKGPPPDGAPCWNGRLIATALGDISKHQVWKFLREHGIYLERRPQLRAHPGSRLSPGSASVIGIYLDPPDNALVVAVNRRPGIEALESPGKPSMPSENGRKLQGAVALFAALEIASDLLAAGRYELRTKREFQCFMDRIVAEHPDREIHVILDRTIARRAYIEELSRRWAKVYFDFTSKETPWLKEVERWFGVLGGGSFPSPRQMRDAIGRLLDVQKPRSAPFKWVSQAVANGRRKSA